MRVDDDTSEPWGGLSDEMSATQGPARRTFSRVGVQLLHLGSTVLGDDWVGRTVRGWLLRLGGASLGPGVTIHGGGYISRPSRLTVGPGSFINRNCYLDLEGKLTLGTRVAVGHGATFITSIHQLGPSDNRCGGYLGASTVVEDGAWIGANVTVMPGVRIGRGAVVAAGAVVTGDVPADVVVAGVPATVLRRLDDADPVDHEANGVVDLGVLNEPRESGRGPEITWTT